MSPNGHGTKQPHVGGRGMMSPNGNGTKQPHVGGRGGDVPAERRCGGMVDVTSLIYAYPCTRMTLMDLMQCIELN